MRGLSSGSKIWTNCVCSSTSGVLESSWGSSCRLSQVHQAINHAVADIVSLPGPPGWPHWLEEGRTEKRSPTARGSAWAGLWWALSSLPAVHVKEGLSPPGRGWHRVNMARGDFTVEAVSPPDHKTLAAPGSVLFLSLSWCNLDAGGA